MSTTSPDTLTDAQVKAAGITITAKTHLVIVGEIAYARDGRLWVRLD
jgi:hypothetical protein